MKTKPRVSNIHDKVRSRIFVVQELDLEFSNGEKRSYERLRNSPAGSVLVVAIKDDQLVLVREYAAGVDRYELGFVKGLVDRGEEILDAANRELMEEAGFTANKLTLLKTISTSPGYMQSQVHIVLAEDLTEKKLKGDEPEELEVVCYPLSKINDLLTRDDFTDARCIAALYLLQEKHNG